MALSNSNVKQHCRMAVLNGVFERHCWTSFSNGVVKWCCQMALSNGVVKWHCQMALSTGWLKGNVAITVLYRSAFTLTSLYMNQNLIYILMPDYDVERSVLMRPFRWYIAFDSTMYGSWSIRVFVSTTPITPGVPQTLQPLPLYIDPSRAGSHKP